MNVLQPSMEQLQAILGVLLALGAISYSLVRFLRQGQYMISTTLVFLGLSVVVLGGYWAFWKRRTEQPPAVASQTGPERAPKTDGAGAEPKPAADKPLLDARVVGRLSPSSPAPNDKPPSKPQGPNTRRAKPTRLAGSASKTAPR